MQKLWHKFVDGKDGKPVLAQRPNAPIIIWAVLAIVARFIHSSPWHTILSALSGVSLTVWAILEIGWGASYFRRTLGAVVLVFTVVTRLLG